HVFQLLACVLLAHDAPLDVGSRAYNPSPFLRARTPSSQRFSSLPLGYSADSDWPSFQKRGSPPTDSSVRNRFSPSPRSAPNKIIAWWRRSNTVAPGLIDDRSPCPPDGASDPPNSANRSPVFGLNRRRPAGAAGFVSAPNRWRVRSATGSRRAVLPWTST